MLIDSGAGTDKT